jgi:hypothetical protein
MNNIKCNQCGFANWANAEKCRKCHGSLAESAPSSSSPKPKPAPVIQKPSTFQILKNDAFAFIAIIPAILMWGFYIGVTFFGVAVESRRSGTVIDNSGNNPLFLIMPIVLTVLGAGLLSWRLTSFNNLFETGERVVGRITDVSFFKDRGRIEFSYSYKRKKFQNGSSIMKNSKTESYRKGEEVILIIDAANPSKVLLQDLYV